MPGARSVGSENGALLVGTRTKSSRSHDRARRFKKYRQYSQQADFPTLGQASIQPALNAVPRGQSFSNDARWLSFVSAAKAVDVSYSEWFSLGTDAADGFSDAAQKLCEADAKSDGNFLDIYQGQISLTAFDAAHVGPV